MISTFTAIFIESSFVTPPPVFSFSYFSRLAWALFVVINPRVLSANRVDLGFVLFPTLLPPPLKESYGSPDYAAPEVLQAGDKSYDGKKADIWSLGVLMCLFVTGDFPFEGDDYFESGTKGVLSFWGNRILSWIFFPSSLNFAVFKNITQGKFNTEDLPPNLIGTAIRGESYLKQVAKPDNCQEYPNKKFRWRHLWTTFYLKPMKILVSVIIIVFGILI